MWASITVGSSIWAFSQIKSVANVSRQRAISRLFRISHSTWAITSGPRDRRASAMPSGMGVPVSCSQKAPRSCRRKSPSCFLLQHPNPLRGGHHCAGALGDGARRVTAERSETAEGRYMGRDGFGIISGKGLLVSYTLTLDEVPQSAAAYVDRSPRLRQELKAIFVAVVTTHMKEAEAVQAHRPTLVELFRDCPVDVDLNDLIPPRAGRIGRAHPVDFTNLFSEEA